MGDRLRLAERRDAVLAGVIAGNGRVEDLASRLGVSTATVRRDLAHLVAAGMVARTYGGAVTGPRPLEQRLRQKERSHREEKHAIAAEAADLVEAGDVLVLDAGTTTGRLAWHLRHRSGLTVITNGTNSLVTLAEADGLEVIVLGGRLRHSTQGMVGPMAEEALRYVLADKVFLGADGVAAGRGLSCPTLEQAALKRLMASRGRKVFVLADHFKIGQGPFAYWTPFDQRVTVITDEGVTPAQVAALEQDPHVRLHVAHGTASEVGRR